jgi:hypothetical protein
MGKEPRKAVGGLNTALCAASAALEYLEIGGGGSITPEKEVTYA